jgi:pyruvate/2-oxoglutarate dehydrogenase complex dihydrolipoamide dehydrogenase (E3) component
MTKIKTDIFIIGGGPAASVTAMTAKSNYPDKKITVIKEDKVGLVPCGIPYIFGSTLGDSEKDTMPCGGKTTGIDILIGKIENVDIEKKIATSCAYEISFDKLVFATGSIPFIHQNFKESMHLENVFTIDKSKAKIDALKSYLEDKKKVVVVGTGFIGVEMATELSSVDKEVTLVGTSNHILKNSFDEELACEAEAIVQSQGITIIQGESARRVLEKDGVATGLELCNDTVIEGDVFILATGYQPNTDLAKKAGLKLARYGGIWVDEYMRTRNKDIFAVGDCSGRRDFITRDPSKVMLASTSASEARVAGNSLYKIKYMKGFNGTIAIFSTMIGDTAFASAGVTQAQAENENIDYVAGTFSGVNRHPATIPDAQKQSVKLIAMKHSGRIIGGQVVGGKEAGEIINIIGLAIESELTVYNLISLQVATQPLLTAAPTTYPIVKAAEKITVEID